MNIQSREGWDHGCGESDVFIFLYVCVFDVCICNFLAMRARVRERV